MVMSTVVDNWHFRSGDIIIKRRLSSEERRSSNAAEEYRKLTNFVSSSSGGSFGSDYQRWLSKSDTWSRYRSVGGVEGGAKEGGGRRKMSESAVLALIREQSTSRDESENSSLQHGPVRREFFVKQRVFW